jgi:hypothetical protein
VVSVAGVATSRVSFINGAIKKVPAKRRPLPDESGFEH